MAHLVPMLPPADYHVPSMTSFSVSSSDGIGKIYAWGANPVDAWRVGTDKADQVVSEEKPSSYPDLRLFELRGVRKGLKLALFVYRAASKTWERYSPYVDVDFNIADTYAAALLAGTLPKSRHHKHISYYPFGALQAAQPLTENEFIEKVEDALERIKGNVVGDVVL
jgi:hypothetical protein